MKAILPFSANRVTQPIEDEEFSNLVGDIYDAALDQSLWVSVLEKCVSFVGGCGAALFFKNAATNGGDTYFYTGITPYFRKLYFDQYVMLDPATTGHFFADVEQPIAIEDCISYDEFLETRFYRECLKAWSISSAPCWINPTLMSPCLAFSGTSAMGSPMRARAGGWR